MSRATPSPVERRDTPLDQSSLISTPVLDLAVEVALQRGEVARDSPGNGAGTPTTSSSGAAAAAAYTTASSSSLRKQQQQQSLPQRRGSLPRRASPTLMPSSKVAPAAYAGGSGTASGSRQQRFDSTVDKAPLLAHKEISHSAFSMADVGPMVPYPSAKSSKFGSFSGLTGIQFAPPINLRHGSLATAFETPNPTPGGGVVFSPQGDCLLRYGYGNELFIVNASDGREMELLTTSVGTNVRHAAFSPDGNYVVAAADDSTCHVWRTNDANSRESWSVVSGSHMEPLCMVALSADSQTVVSCDDEGKITVWDVKSGTEVTEFCLDEGIHEADLVAFVRGGQALLSCGQLSAEVMLIEAATGRLISAHRIEEFADSRNRIIYVISNDASKLIVYLLDQVTSGDNVVVFDIATCKHTSLEANSGGVTHAELCADGSIMATCGRDNRIQVWTTRDVTLITTLEGHGADVLYCKISGDRRVAMSGDSNGCVLVWDLVKGTPSMRLQAHTSPVVFCDLAKDGMRALSVDAQGHAYLWHLDVRRLFDLLRMQSDDICCIEVFHMPELRASASLECLTDDSATDVRLKSGSTTLAVGYVDGTLQLWSVETSQVTWSHGEHRCPVQTMCLTADGLRLVSAGRDGRLLVTHLASGVVCAEMRQHHDVVTALYRSVDGALLMSTSRDGVIMLWPADVGTSDGMSIPLPPTSRRTFDGNSGLAGVAAAAPGASWLPEPAPLVQLSSEDNSEIMSAAASPSGRTIGAACRSGRAFVWSKSDTGSGLWSLIHELHVTDVPATAIIFSNRGRLIAVGSADGSTTVFDASTGAVLASLVANASPICSVYFEETLEASGDADSISSVRTKTSGVFLVTVCSRQAIKWDVQAETKVRSADFISDLEGTFFNAKLTDRVFVANDGIAFFDPKLSAAVYDTVPRNEGSSSHLGNSFMLRRSTYLLNMALGVTFDEGPTEFNCPLVIYARPDITAHMVATEAAGIRTLDFSSDGHLIVTGSLRGDLQVWDVAHRLGLQKWSAHKRAAITCVKFSHDGEAVYSCGEDGKVILWDWRSRQMLSKLDGHLAPVTHVDMSLDGCVLVSSDRAGTINIWDAHIRGPPKQSLHHHDGPIVSCSVSPDGSLVASSGMDEHVYIHCTATGALITCLDDALDGVGLSLKFSFDGTRLQIGGEHGELLIWDVHSSCMLFHIAAHEGKVFDSSWSGDSRVSLTVGADGRARAWDSASGCWLCEANFEHGFGVFETGGVIKGDLSVNGDIMAGCTAKGHLLIWDIASELRKLPDGSLLYEWLASMPLSRAQDMYRKILASFPHIVNKQDGQGWTILMHAASHRNPEIVSIITSNMAPDSEGLGLVSSALQNSVGRSSRGLEKAGTTGRAWSGRQSGFSAFHESVDAVVAWLTGRGGKEATELQVSRYAAGVEPNALKIALAVSSADCVQHMLDAVLLGKVSNGSSRALAEALRVMLECYPAMCQQFLTMLTLKPLGQIEIPVDELKQAVIVRASTSYTSYREMWETEFQLNEAEAGPKALMLASMVRLPDMATAGTHSFLHALVESNIPLRVFGCDSVKAIIDYKWIKFARGKIYAKALWYILFVLLFSIYAVLFTHDYPEHTFTEWVAAPSGMACFLLGAICMVFASGYLGLEMYQLAKLGPVNYFDSFWNIIDIISYTLILVVVPCHVARFGILKGAFLPMLMSLSVIMVWVKLLFFGLAIDGFGTFIFMTFEILSGIRYFLVLLMILFVAFAISFMVIFRTNFAVNDSSSGGSVAAPAPPTRRLLQTSSSPDDPATVGDVLDALDAKIGELITPAIDALSNPIVAQYQTFQGALLQSYMAVFALINPSDCFESDYPDYAVALMCVFMFIIYLLLLNMLIALMAHIHNSVREKQHFVFLNGRAKLIVEVESTMSNMDLAKLATPPFLHVLQSKLHNDADKDGGSRPSGDADGGGGLAPPYGGGGTLNADSMAKIADLVFERLQSSKVVAGLVSSQVDQVVAAFQQQQQPSSTSHTRPVTAAAPPSVVSAVAPPIATAHLGHMPSFRHTPSFGRAPSHRRPMVDFSRTSASSIRPLTPPPPTPATGGSIRPMTPQTLQPPQSLLLMPPQPQPQPQPLLLMPPPPPLAEESTFAVVSHL